MSSAIAGWPAWLPPIVWTAITIGLAWVIGKLINAVFVARLVHLTSRTRGTWDDVLIEELKRRVPWWSILVGAWLSLGHWTLTPYVRTFAGRGLFALAVVSVTLLLASFAERAISAYGRTVSPLVPVTGLTQNLVWLFVVVLGLLVLLNGLGVSITPMLTALGVGGLAVALALQDPLSNLFSGLFLTLAGQLRIGDYVRLESGLEGYIVDFSWRATRIRMLANNLILVPNAKLAQEVLTNYSLPHQDLAVLVEVGVDYASKLDHVERVTIEVARDVLKTVQGGVPDFDPFIRYHTFGSSSIDFTVILRGKEYVDQYLIKHEFVKRLHARYDQEGIIIPFPIRTLAARDPIPVVTVSPPAGPPAP